MEFAGDDMLQPGRRAARPPHRRGVPGHRRRPQPGAHDRHAGRPSRCASTRGLPREAAWARPPSCSPKSGCRVRRSLMAQLSAPAFGRHEAARGDRHGAGQPSPTCCCSTSRPPRSTSRWRRRSSTCCDRLRAARPVDAAGQPQSRHRRPAVRPGRGALCRAGGRDWRSAPCWAGRATPTRGLLAALPRPDVPGARLAPIPGGLPDLTRPEPGCNFAPRCPFATAGCERPQLLLGTDHQHGVTGWARSVISLGAWQNKCLLPQPPLGTGEKGRSSVPKPAAPLFQRRIVSSALRARGYRCAGGGRCVDINRQR